MGFLIQNNSAEYIYKYGSKTMKRRQVWHLLCCCFYGVKARMVCHAVTRQ